MTVTAKLMDLWSLEYVLFVLLTVDGFATALFISTAEQEDEAQ